MAPSRFICFWSKSSSIFSLSNLQHMMVVLWQLRGGVALLATGGGGGEGECTVAHHCSCPGQAVQGHRRKATRGRMCVLGAGMKGRVDNSKQQQQYNATIQPRHDIASSVQ